MNNYQNLIMRWLTGANTGKCRNLYVTTRGRGVSLAIRGLHLYHSFNINKMCSCCAPRNWRRPVKYPQDTRLAVLQNGTVHILTAHDALGVADIAKRLGLNVKEYEPRDFKADGTIKGGIIN